MPPTVVRFADVPPEPWKNGGGLTRELWREPATGPFSLRISVADVDRAGPFSLFPGVDRVITLLHGAGFELRGPAGQHRVTEVGAPLAFAGEDAWDCALVAGPVRDFNVMVTREREAGVRRVGPGALPPDAWALALEDGVTVHTEGAALRLARWDLVHWRGPAALVEGAALLVEVTPGR